MITTLRSIDLFAGCGGLSIGMRTAGIEIVAAVERDKDCIATLKQHFRDARLHKEDIRSVNLNAYRGSIDLVVGGPPCQPFSSGGLRAGARDERNMVPHFVSAITTLKPKLFLMENVRGLVVKERRSYFEDLLRAFSDLGYSVTWQVLNAADYGVPQKRIRLFIVGSLQGKFAFPKPSHGPDRQIPHLTVRNSLPSEQMGEPNLSKVTYAKNPDIRPSPYHGQLFNGGGRPLHLDQPAPTILAAAGGNKTHFLDIDNLVPQYHEHLIQGGIPWRGTLPGARRLTIEESAIIQTFPKGFSLAGSRSSQYRQVGNAVPPVLATILGRSLIEHAKKESAFPNNTKKRKTDLYRQPSLFSA